MLPLLLLGCARPDPTLSPLSHPLPPGPTVPPVPTTPSDPTTADVGHAACETDPLDPLRATCRLSLSWPVPAEIELTDGAEGVVFSTSEAVLRPEIPIWGLTADATWTWTARAGGAEVTGQLVTGPLPEPVRVEIEVSGDGPSSLVHVLMPLDCDDGGYASIVDTHGRVRWTVDMGGGDVDMVQFTEAGTVLGITDQESVVEVDLTGREIFRKEGLYEPIHHDVFRRDDVVYTFLAVARPADDGNLYVEDVVVGFDRAGAEVYRWDERDWIDPTLSGRLPGGFWSRRYPGSIDAWHSNSLYVTEEGDLLVSLNREDTVLRVSRADGSLEWVLAGDNGGDVIPATLALVGFDPSFGDQHHAALLPDGHLTVFDNRGDRAIELAIDEDAGTATLIDEWTLGLNCPVQSSLFPLPGGGRVMTCGEQHTFAEFDAVGVEVGRHRLTCPNGANLPRTTRGHPLDLWGGTRVGAITATRIR